uniref:Uncharacterized protein n=1 Tax=Meloidogyne javanica TaxID=6303 RepID=A0A915LYT3_MELJA
MSGRIRRGLTTALESIQDYTKNATQIMKEDVDEDTAGKLGVEKANLESAIALIAELDDKWGNYIDSLEAPQRMAEESVYMSFPYKAGRFEDGKEVPLSQRHFLDQNQFAREVLNMIKETIKSLECSRTNSRQSALSENNHSVDLNEERNDPNVGIENLNARMNQLEMNNVRRNNARMSEYHAPQPRVNLPLLQLPQKEILPGLYSIQTVFGTMTAGETDFGQNSEKKSMSLVAVHVSNNKPLPMPDAVEDFRSMESPVQNHAEVEANLNHCPILTISGEADAPLPLRPTDLVVPHGTISLKIHSADQNQLVKYPMFARAKGKLVASTLVALCLVCLLNITMAIKSCSICLIPCILAGVMVFGPIGKQKTEICCEYESPTEMLSTDYHSVAKFWKSSREMFSTEMTCRPLNACLVLNSTFGIDRLVNPFCNPSLAFLWALVTLTAFFGLRFLLTLCRSCHENFRMTVAIGRIGCQCWRWTKGKTSYTRARTRETTRETIRAPDKQ